MMNAIVGNNIAVSNPTAQLIKWCNENLVIPNPEFIKLERMGKWTGKTPRNLVLYERDGDKVYIPFGCFKDLYHAFGQEIRFVPDFRLKSECFYDSSIVPYPYQEEAILASIEAKNGVIVMPCGAGKTQTALEIIARIGGRALWLTHTQDLLNQSMNRAKSVFGIDKITYGTITGGKVNAGIGITFATVQTMAKINLSQFKYSWDVIIVDECHKAIGSPTKVMQFYKVLSSLSARYKFGLTATPKRADGLEKSMFALLGGIIHEVPREAVADTTCPVEVVTVNTNYTPDMDRVLLGDGTLNYTSLVSDLTENHDRFMLVSDIVRECSGSGATLVLANRVDYLKRMASITPDSMCLSALGASRASKKARNEAISRLNDGDIKCLFATYQLAKEGLDIPNLRYLVLATPEKDETTVTQAVGRVARKSEGKDKGVVVDIVDSFGLLKGWHKKRLRIYKKSKYVLTDKTV